jgi:hypothetical protein
MIASLQRSSVIKEFVGFYLFKVKALCFAEIFILSYLEGRALLAPQTIFIYLGFIYPKTGLIRNHALSLV